MVGEPHRAVSWRDWRLIMKLQTHTDEQAWQSRGDGKRGGTEEAGWPLWLGDVLLRANK